MITWGDILDTPATQRAYTVRPDLWPIGSVVRVHGEWGPHTAWAAEYGTNRDRLNRLATAAEYVGLDRPGVAEAAVLAGQVDDIP